MVVDSQFIYSDATTTLHNQALIKNKKIRVKTYRIDFETSNYHADLENSNLQLVEEKVYENVKAFNKTVFLHPNALQLLVLEPAGKK